MKKELLMNLTVENAECITTVCKEIKSEFDVDIDVKYGRYIVDGCSILGIYSMVNHIVKICPVTENPEILKTIFAKFVPLGAFN